MILPVCLRLFYRMVLILSNILFTLMHAAYTKYYILIVSPNQKTTRMKTNYAAILSDWFLHPLCFTHIPERVPIYLQNLILNVVGMNMIFQTYYASNNIHTPTSEDLKDTWMLICCHLNLLRKFEVHSRSFHRLLIFKPRKISTFKTGICRLWRLNS